MVNTAAFGKRIQEIMKFYHVSASGFADAMGVGRSSISHILSGRNKPSLDFVMKVTEAYPEAELYWLLYGQGSFPKSEAPIQQQEEIPEQKEPITPTPIALHTEVESEQDLFSQSDNTSLPNDIPEETTSSRIKTTSGTKNVSQIVFFYTDGTFDVYKN
ncbi:Transcriptional regulator, contains XRE-family HTH domain [Aquimarina amphilecti]|uniref:Transcriptional regulator, contains XRE-family HTH domain n=1 Tax=Aquimarina amphilecti TaxID=1038014 RepID=A0A1H7I7V8_AQUAM|nr:helix-turn-helix transcriptional regulator [Aquimarina amphilecti]SEK56655.1 Transcriptional regulator, contains XRE-family HTH domain [Aquimarina amphilecti]